MHLLGVARRHARYVQESAGLVPVVAEPVDGFALDAAPEFRRASPPRADEDVGKVAQCHACGSQAGGTRPLIRVIKMSFGRCLARIVSILQ